MKSDLDSFHEATEIVKTLPGFDDQPVFNTGQMGAALANYLFYVLRGRRVALG